jgi:hypothetical protein
MNSPNSNNVMPPRGLTSDPESRLTAALEHKPEVHIPLDFASQVTALAVTQPLRRRRYAPRFGRAVALFSVPLASLALFALAPHASPNLKSLSFDTEVVLLAELALIGWWIGRMSQHMTR